MITQLVGFKKLTGTCYEGFEPLRP